MYLHPFKGFLVRGISSKCKAKNRIQQQKCYDSFKEEPKPPNVSKRNAENSHVAKIRNPYVLYANNGTDATISRHYPFYFENILFNLQLIHSGNIIKQ